MKHTALFSGESAIQFPVKILACFALAILLVACGGGSGGAPEEPSSGSFTLLVGDDDISDFDQAIFQISKITLLGNDAGPVVVLDELREIDFLALETVNEVLAEAEVPTGTYSKIRLQVDSITLKEFDENDVLLREVSVDLVANGKVDVVTGGDFRIGDGQSLALAIDIDLEKSIKVHVTGNGRYKFRPVIFASVLTGEDPGRLVRIEGQFEFIQLENLVRASDRFNVCNVDLMSDSDTVADTTACRLVMVDPATGLFTIVGGALVATTVDAINNGDNVVVYGLLAVETETTGLLPLNAVVVGQGVFQHLEGTIASVFDQPTETFEQVLDEGQGLVGDLQVSTHLPLSLNAALFDDQGQPAEIADIVDGVDVEVEGLLQLGVPNAVDAFIAILDSSVGETTVSGMVTAINLLQQVITITDSEDVEYCVQVNSDTIIQQVTDLGAVVETGSITLDQLTTAVIEVTGMVNESDCIEASTIVVGSV